MNQSRHKLVNPILRKCANYQEMVRSYTFKVGTKMNMGRPYTVKENGYILHYWNIHFLRQEVAKLINRSYYKILCFKSLLSLWFTTIHKMQVLYILHETSPFPFLLKAIYTCIMFIIKSFTGHSYVLIVSNDHFVFEIECYYAEKYLSLSSQCW